MTSFCVYSNKKGFWASKLAQDKQKIYDNEKCLVEVIKYGTKIITVPKDNESHIDQIPPIIYANALHNILVSMNGLRLFERFGFNANFKPKTKHEMVLKNYEILTYNPSIGDWEDDNNISISNFQLPDNWKHLLEFNIDLELE